MAGKKLNDNQIKERIDAAYQKRYVENYTQIRYVKWAKEEYKDNNPKSEQQYCQYFTKSKDVHTEAWKDKLDKLLDPAADELVRLLADEQPKIRQRAIDQIMKFTGNDITKQEIKATVENIKVGFGQDE